VRPPEVIASGQGSLGQMAASGTFVVWAVQPQGGHPGSIVGLHDEPNQMPAPIAGNQTNPGEIAIATGGTVFWENFLSGARDPMGNRVIDGSIWSSVGGQLASGLSPSDVGTTSNGKLAYGRLDTSSIECAPCNAPLTANQPAPNALTAHGNFVYWNTV